MNDTSPQPAPLPLHRPWRHRFAIAFVIATFLLIALGGTVTSKGAGLAVPDWPTTFNYNMILFPPSMWVGGIFWEHSHRLMGMLVGLFAIGMAIWLWQTEGRSQESGDRGQGTGDRRQGTESNIESPPTPVGGSARPWLQWFGIATLIAVSFQGVMGGLRVTELSTTWAVFHGITAQLVLCMTVLIAAATSRWWMALRAPSRQGGAMSEQRSGGNVAIDNRAPTAPPCRDGARLLRLVYIALAAILIQLTLGATMRHHGAGIAIPDFPLAYGDLVPPMTEAGIHDAMIAWSDDPNSFGITEHGWYSPFQVAIHWAHRLFAVVAIIVVGLMVDTIRRRAKGMSKLRTPAIAVGVMLLLQVLLGASIIWTGRHPEVATAHQTLGAVLLATTALIAFRLKAIADCGSRIADCNADSSSPDRHPTGRDSQSAIRNPQSAMAFAQGARA
ncbi:MAG: COX15/CtaA family protein [Phycisphaeraceae bacterium]